MRRLLIAAPIVLVSAAGAAAAWHYLRPQDPLIEANQLAQHGDLRGAQLVLRNAVQADPARASTHLGLGQIQLRLGDAVAAEHEFRMAASHGAAAKTLQPLLAQAVVAQGRNEEVLRDYTPDGLAPEDAATVLVARARAQLGLGHQQDATASIAQARQLMPKSLDVAMVATQIAMAGKDWAQAQSRVADALAIDPHDLRALTTRAQIQALRGDLAAAVTSYGETIDQAAKSNDHGAVDVPRLARAGLRAQLGDTTGARTDLDAVLKDRPKWVPAQYLSAQLYARAANWRAADAALTVIGPVVSNLPMGDLTLAMVKANVGEPEQALAAAESQVGHTPTNLAAVKLLTRLELARHQPARAAQVLTAAKEAGATLDTEALDLLSLAYSSSGQSSEAMGALSQAVASRPGDTEQPARLVATEPRPDDAPSPQKALGPAPAMTDAGARGTGQAAAALVAAALRSGNIDQAAAALDRLRQAKGDPAQIALLDGMVKLAQIDLAGARHAFEQVVHLAPKSLFAQISLARVMAMQGETEPAAARLTDIQATDHGNASALGTLVALRLAAGQTDKAVAAAEAAHQAAPSSAGVTQELVRLYLATNQPQKALTLLDAAGASPATDRADVQARVQAQLALKQNDAAVHTLRSALDRTPDDVGFRREAAELLSAGGDSDGAAALLRDGLARSAGNVSLLAGLVDVANRAGGVDAALARLAELGRDPANTAVPMLKGDFLLAQKRFPDAIAAYEAMASSAPAGDQRGALARFRIAQALAASGQSDQAAARLADWLKEHPDDIQSGLFLASLDIDAKRLPEARLRLEAVLAAQPNNGAALNNLAWICQQQGDLAQAHMFASRAYLLLPSPQSADTLGWVLLAQGKVPDALALLREASNGQPRDGAIRYHLAAALARDGQKGQAVTLLKALLDQGTTSPAFSEKPQAVKLLSDLSS